MEAVSKENGGRKQKQLRQTSEKMEADSRENGGRRLRE